MTAGFDVGITREQLHLIETCVLNYDIIWLTDEISSLANNTQFRELINELSVSLGLQYIQQYIYIYDNVERCIDRLCSNSHNRSIIFFISRNERLNTRDYSLICDLPKVEYIYELGSNNPCRKIGGEIFDNVNQLTQVESDLHILPPNLDTTSLHNFDPEIKKYFIKQLLLEILQKLPHTEREKEIFVEFFLRNCDQTANHVEHIRQEIGNLSQRSAIWFYTGDHIHRVMSRILRQANPVSMIKMHYFIHRLYSELRRLHHSQLSNKLKSKVTVYRGKKMSHQELYRFQRAVNRLVLTNSFVSTSRDREVALRSSGQDQPQSSGQISVLFLIKIAAFDNPSRPIAFLENTAQNGFENELLLTSGIIFLVQSVKKNIKVESIEFFPSVLIFE